MVRKKVVGVNVKTVIDKGIRVVFISAYLFISLVLLFTTIDESKSARLKQTIFVVEIIPDIVWVLLAVTLLAGYAIWNRKHPEKQVEKKQVYVEIVPAMLVLVVLQAVVFYSIYFYPGADAHFVKYAAETFTSGHIDYSNPDVAYFLVQYFQECPNNLWLFFIEIVFCYIGKIFSCNGYHLLMGFTVVMADIAIVLSVMTVYRLTGSRRLCRVTFVMAVLLLGFSTWLFYPYTDSMTILFPVLILYLYVRFRESGTLKMWQWVTLTAIALFAYKLKALASIVFIALLCYEMVTNGLCLRRISAAICGSMIAVLLISQINAGICHYVNYEKDESLELPFIYFAALGSNYETYGKWTQEARDYICSFDTAEEKKKASWEMIKENYAEMGSLWNVFDHYKNAIHYNYNDASFGVGVGVPFIEVRKPSDNVIIKFLRNVLYPAKNYGDSTYFGHGGEYYLFTVCVWQFIWMSALFLCGLTALFSKLFVGTNIDEGKKETADENRKESVNESLDRVIYVLQITYVGILIYMLLFESNSRLMLCNVLVFILMGTLGVHRMCERWEPAGDKNKQDRRAERNEGRYAAEKHIEKQYK